MQQWPQSEEAVDAIAFVDDGELDARIVSQGPGLARWKILVVDDDEDVHTVTRYVLGKAEILGRSLELIEARSLAEAQHQLVAHPDVAVVLLDVVMEEHDSGLKFVRWVREAGLSDVRIILRTGQPGYAPELDVIRDYDINDYRAKSELTHARLITSITAAIRTFQQIDTTERTWRGMERILASCSQLFARRDLAGFADGVLLQMASLCGFRGEGMICALAPGEASREAHIVAGMGAMARQTGRRLCDLPEGHAWKELSLQSRRERSSAGEPVIVPMETQDKRFVCVLGHTDLLDPMDEALLRLFAAHVAIGFDNVEFIERLARRA